MYYAQWANGSWCSEATEQINNYLTEIYNRSDDSKVLAMAFGYNGAYVISFGWATRSTIRGKSGHQRDLKGYYSDLNQFADANTSLDIVVSLSNCLDQISEISLSNRPSHLTRIAQQIIY